MRSLSRWRMWLVVWSAAGAWDSAAAAQEIPFLRKLLEQKMIEELAEHNSQGKAWYNEKTVDRKKWTDGKLLGRKIRLASWTEQSKTWLWLEDPAAKLTLELKRVSVRDARLEFAVAVNAKARFKAWGRIPKLGQAAVGGTTSVAFEVEGSTAMGGGGLKDSQIRLFKGRLENLNFNNDAANPFEDLVEDALNDYVKNKNEKLRRSIEKAIDRVKF